MSGRTEGIMEESKKGMQKDRKHRIVRYSRTG
jgi:hypothetical protein